MRQLLLVLALALTVAAVGYTRFKATGVIIRNRPFVTGALEATEFFYDKPNNRTAWTFKASPTIPNVSLREAYLYTKNLRLRKCADDCEALGEDLAVPDLVSSGSTNGNSKPSCPNCYTKNPTPQNGLVEEVCYSGQAVCYAKLSTGEEWFITGAASVNSFPSDTFLASVENDLGGKCGESCNQKFDIVLVLDESGSIDSTEWSQLKAFAVALVQAFDVGPDDANFAIKLYSTTARDRLTLSPSLNAIINQLNGIDKKSQWTCIGCGLKLANDELDTNKRPGVPGLIITLTDGFNNRPCDFDTCCAGGNACGSGCCRGVAPYKTNHDSPRTTNCATCGSRPLLQQQHDRADAAGYKMISIGVGPDLNDDDLELISTNWPEDHIAVDNFADLKNKLAEILRVVCPKSPVNECGTTCNGYCHCGKTCGCPICEDKDKCHTAECKVGAGYACVQTEITCDDKNLCTVDSCDPATGCKTEPVNCDSGKDCKVDTCDPKTGCKSTNRQCPSNDGCEEPRCDERNKQGGGGCKTTTVTDAMCASRAVAPFNTACYRHFCSDGCKREKIDCDQGNACFTYSCDDVAGCQSEDISSTCNKGSMCKTYGCDPAVGCFDEDIVCNDGLVCTTDTCDPATGCQFNTNADCGPCKHLDDSEVDCAAELAGQINGDACLVPFCDLSGPTAAENPLAPVMNCMLTDRHKTCVTGNQCFTEGCDSTTGLCTRAPINCDDSDMCTIDTCDPATGCVHETITCDPRSACETATCDKALGCVYTPIDCTALGNDPCKTFTCDDAAGCMFEAKCKVPNNCFSVKCEPVTGNCTTTYLCDDNNACTDDSCDFSNNVEGVCVNAAFNVTEKCNDHSVCTEDVCDPVNGCTNNYIECPMVNETIPCKTAQPCNPLTGCSITKVDCPSNDKCFSESCEYANATAKTPAANTCKQTPIDNVLYCDLGIGATTGIALGAGIIFAIICAVVVVGILGSIGAWKAYDALMASNIDSGLASPNPLHDPGVTEGVNPLS